MFVDKCISRQHGKVYVSYLVRESYREGKRVCKKTILNLTPLGAETCEAIRELFRSRKNEGKNALNVNLLDTILTQKQSFGSVWLVYEIAKRLGFLKAFGDSADGKLLLWQVIAPE